MRLQKDASCRQSICYCLLPIFIRFSKISISDHVVTNAVVNAMSTLSWKLLAQVILGQELTLSLLNLPWLASCVYSLGVYGCLHTYAGNKGWIRTGAVRNKMVLCSQKKK